MDRSFILRTASRASLALPRIKGLGMALEHFSRLFSAWNVDVISRVNGSLMRLNPSNRMERHRLFTAKYHDRHEFAFMRKVLRPGDIMVDVGANVGSYALVAAQAVGPTGEVIAIEADPDNARQLRDNVELNDYRQVRVEQIGVSDKVEMLTLHHHPDNFGAHSFAIDHGSGSTAIACVPLAQLVGNCRLMKLDIEGFELRVLAPYFEQGFRPEYILIEHCHVDPAPLLGIMGYRLERRMDGNSLFAR